MVEDTEFIDPRVKISHLCRRQCTSSFENENAFYDFGGGGRGGKKKTNHKSRGNV